MFRPTARAIARATATSSAISRRSLPTRRWASTVPADKSRSWKSSAVRWGLAGAVVYYYNTNNVFAESSENQYAHYPPPATSDTEVLPTLDSYAKKSKPAVPSAVPAAASDIATAPDASSSSPPAPSGGAGDLEQDAAQQGAFNEETGEINWDCPCLGGMANGPCGEDFKAAFSCFVYSQEEPKGVDCIEKFKGMQDCFRAHPDIYGAELEDDNEEGALQGDELEGTPALAKDSAAPSSTALENPATPAPVDTEVKTTVAGGQRDAQGSKERASAAKAEIKAKHTETSETESVIPKAWHDGTDEAKDEKSKS